MFLFPSQSRLPACQLSHWESQVLPPGKFQFNCHRNESGGPNGVPMVTGLPGSNCHRALPDNSQFDLRRNESGGPNGMLTIAGLPGSSCHQALPGKLQLDCRRDEPGWPNGLPTIAGLPVSSCHRALPGKFQFEAMFSLSYSQTEDKASETLSVHKLGL